MSAHASKTLRVTHEQYREYAEICKREAGKPLNLTSLKDLDGCWGMVNFWGLPMMDDVSVPPGQCFYSGSEKAYIYLSSSINVEQFRAVGRNRPECDWSQLADEEIYPFVVWHEVGHIRDNFSAIEAAFTRTDDAEFKAALENIGRVNEILADRFAWSRIRPGEAMPLTDAGQCDADKIERDIADLSRFMIRAKYPVKPLPAGQYRSVPAYMLSSKRKAAFVGPDVDPARLAKEVAYHRDYKANRGSYMSGVAL